MKSEKITRKNTFSCPHLEEKANIYYDIVYPSSILPESLPRIINRYCQQGLDCKLLDKSACPAGIQLISQ